MTMTVVALLIFTRWSWSQICLTIGLFLLSLGISYLCCWSLLSRSSLSPIYCKLHDEQGMLYPFDTRRPAFRRHMGYYPKKAPNDYRLIGAALIGIILMLTSYFKINILVKCRVYSTKGLKGIYIWLSNWAFGYTIAKVWFSCDIGALNDPYKT